MRIQRGRHTPEFKAKVALIALMEQQPINEIASRYEVHPGQVSQWKKQAKDELPSLFNDRREKDHQNRLEEEALRDQLYQQIGQLKVELDFLKKKTGALR